MAELRKTWKAVVNEWMINDESNVAPSALRYLALHLQSLADEERQEALIWAINNLKRLEREDWGALSFGEYVYTNYLNSIKGG